MAFRAWLESWFWLALALASLAGCGHDQSTVSDGESSSTKNVQESQASDDPVTAVLPLKMLVVGDPPLAESIGRQWQAMTGQPLDTVVWTVAELEQASGPLNADFIIYPTGYLGTLAERGQIVPMPKEVEEGTSLRRRDLLEMTRLRETVWGETTFAVPLGAQQLLVLYRKDLLEQLGAKPPASWSEYQTLAGQLSSRAMQDGQSPTDSSSWCGVAEPLGPGWGGHVLLARAAAYARHRSQYSTVFDFTTLRPRIDSPPFERALVELVAAAKVGASDALKMTPDDARRTLFAGRCGLALAWPSPGQGEEHVEAGVDERAVAQIGVARLPGSWEMYNASESRWERRGEDEPRHVSLLGIGGRLGSVTKSSRQARGAFNFLAMLSGAEWHSRVLATGAGAGLFRISHVDSPARWVDAALPGATAAEFGRVTQQIHRENGWFFAPRVPGRSEYLAALDEAVAAAVEGKASPAEALQAAAARWEQITNERGRDSQRKAYRRCLGLEK